VKWVKKNCN